MEHVNSFLKSHRHKILFSLLTIYIFLLGLGVIAELFHIQWILDLPLYKI